MKKFLLSFSLVVLFVIYALSKRAIDASSVVVDPQTTIPSHPISQSPAVSTPAPTRISNTYRDGQFTGALADAYYGYVQVRATIAQGKISELAFLSYPNDRNHSIQINTYAMPILKSEAIQVQSAQVDTVSGASETSGAFRESLSSALHQALN